MEETRLRFRAALIGYLNAVIAFIADLYCRGNRRSSCMATVFVYVVELDDFILCLYVHGCMRAALW